MQTLEETHENQVMNMLILKCIINHLHLSVHTHVHTHTHTQNDMTKWVINGK